MLYCSSFTSQLSSLHSFRYNKSRVVYSGFEMYNHLFPKNQTLPKCHKYSCRVYMCVYYKVFAFRARAAAASIWYYRYTQSSTKHTEWSLRFTRFITTNRCYNFNSFLPLPLSLFIFLFHIPYTYKKFVCWEWGR